jgi:hypothetical protein
MDLAQDIAHAYTLDSLFQQCVELNSFAVRRDMQAFALGRSNFICLSDLCGKLGFFVPAWGTSIRCWLGYGMLFFRLS